MKWMWMMPAALLMLSAAADQHEGPSSTVQKIRQALQHERRPESHTVRDDNRKPLETLQFMGLAEDMTVLELLPGGGWYTNILGPVLEENGKLYISVGAERVGESVAGEDGFASTEVIPFSRENFQRTESSRRMTVPAFSFGVDDVDLALTFRNMHNFTAEGRANINRAVFEALASGGHYGVVDHTRRHMQQTYYENWRRTDPVKIIKEVQAAGFELVDYATLHYRADDELRYEVGRATVTGNTDRYSLLFRKP